MKNKELRRLAKSDLHSKWWLSVGVLFLGFLIIGAASNASFVGVVFLGYPIYYGIAKFFMAVKNKFGEFEDLFSGFKENYIDNILTFLLKDVLILAWSLLLVVPGVIKSIAYSMTPYILVDYDYTVTHMDALKKSEEIMEGYKMKYFKMQLYFILWHLLGILTGGILTYLYVLPYQYMSNVEFYYDIKSKLDIEKKFDKNQQVPPVEEISDKEWDF